MSVSSSSTALDACVWTSIRHRSAGVEVRGREVREQRGHYALRVSRPLVALGSLSNLFELVFHYVFQSDVVDPVGGIWCQG